MSDQELKPPEIALINAACVLGMIAHNPEIKLPPDLKRSAVQAIAECEQSARATPSPDGAAEQSDGHHTLSELYEHRHALFIALMKSHRDLAWCSRAHSDGTMYEGWFIAGLDLPTGRISYRLPIDLFSELDDIAILEDAPVWDGYTPSDVVARLKQWEPSRGAPDGAARAAAH